MAEPVRVLVEHYPNELHMLGLVDPSECTPTLTLHNTIDGSEQQFYRAASREGRWVLYKPALVQAAGQ